MTFGEFQEQRFHQCVNCGIWGEPQDFLRDSRTLKNCPICREKDQNSNRDHEKRKEQQKEKQYYKAYRARKREADEEGFLKHNAEVMKKWRESNHEYWREYCRNNLVVNLNGIRGQSKKKGLAWDLTTEQAKEIMSRSCFYCGQMHEKGFGGIDRLENHKGYTLDNVVGCCGVCNFIKHALDPLTFVQRCEHLSVVNNIKSGEIHPHLFPNGESIGYQGYVSRAKRKGFDIITKDEYDSIFSLRPTCTYCKAALGSGMDRIDNSKGYTLDNIAPCCSECNYMKGGLETREFLDKCAMIRLDEQKIAIVSGIVREMNSRAKR